MATRKRWLGIKFPFQFGPTGLPEVSSDDQLIRDSLMSLLTTGRHERVMRPTVGINAYGMVFNDFSAIEKARVANDVRVAIEQNEPRVRVVSVIPTDGPSEGEITISIVYSVAGRLDTLAVPIDVMVG